MDRHNPWPLGLCSFHHLRPVLFLAAFFPPFPCNFSETSHSCLLQVSKHRFLRFIILWFPTLPHHKCMTEPFVAAATGADHPSQRVSSLPRGSRRSRWPLREIVRDWQGGRSIYRDQSEMISIAREQCIEGSRRPRARSISTTSTCASSHVFAFGGAQGRREHEADAT